MISRSPLLLLAVAAVIAACTSNPSSPPVVASDLPSATPSSSRGAFIDCGPLALEDCQKAVAVALDTFPAVHPPFRVVRIADPSAIETCPPSGGPVDVPPSGPPSYRHDCEVIVTVTTSDGDVEVGLIRGGPNDWIWAELLF